YFIVGILVLIAIYFFLRHFSKSILKTILFLVALALLRTLMIYFNLPESLYDHGIFSPTNYASSFYFDSLGDMLINASFYLVLSICLYQNILILRNYKYLYLLFCIACAVGIHF